MAAKCPSKSHPDWKLMVRLFGEENALFYYDTLGTIPTINIIAEIYKQEKGVELTDTNNPEVWDIEASEDLIGRWRTDKRGKSMPVKRAFNPYRANALAKQLRDKYPEAKITVYKFETIQKSNSRIRVSIPLKTVPSLSIKRMTEYEQRPLEDIPQRDLLTPSERKDFEHKKEIMLKTFPWVKGIIEDTKLVNLGQVEQNGTIIRINPVKMSKDTLGHEFGHLIIDVIGGLENPLVKAGLKQLEDTPLAKRIRDAYVDKTETVIQKEILAEAIGIDTAKLFEEEQNRSKWERWLVRFFERIKRTLGIEKGAVRKLSRMVLGSEEFDAIAPVVEEVYESRPKAAKHVDIREDQMAELHKEVIDKLKTKVQIYQRKGAESEIRALKDRIRTIEATPNSTRALVNFVSYAASETSHVYRTYDRAVERFKGGDKSAINAKVLLQWSDHVSAFDIVADIEVALIERFGLERYEKSPYLKEVREYIQTTTTRKNKIKSFLKTEGIDIVADWLTPYTTRIAAEYKLRYEKKWRTLSKDTRPPKDEYLAAQLAVDQDAIETETRARVRAELQKGTFDIGYAYRFAENVLDSDDMVIASMAKAFALTMDKAREASLDKRDELVDRLRELEKLQAQTAGKSDSDFYSFIIEKNAKGEVTNKLVGKFKSEFWDAYEQVRIKNAQILHDTIEAIKLKDTTDIYKEFLIRRAEDANDEANSAWKNLNAPINKPMIMDGKEAYVNKLLKDGILTSEEAKDAIYAIRSPKYVEIATVLLKNEPAANMIEKWGRENVWEYRFPITEWKSAQYEALNKLRETDPTNAKVKFYDLIKDMIKEGEKSLPYRYRLRQSLPFMPKSSGERLAAGQKLTTLGKKWASESFVGQAFDIEKGEVDVQGRAVELLDEEGKPKMFLPVFFTPKSISPFKIVKGEKIEKTKAELAKEQKELIETQSFDIASVYYNWYKMAMEYKYKSEVISEMELTKYLVEQREVDKLDSNKNPILNANEKLKQRHLTKSGMSSMLAAQLTDWFQAVVYGKTSKDEGTFDILGVKIDKAKTLDKLNKYTAFNLLGLNLMQGVANKALGEVMQIADAFSGEHYSMKNYIKAGVQYNSNLTGIIGDIGRRRPTNIINLLLEKFDILHDYGDPDNFNKSTKFRQLMTSNALFFMAKAGEHSMQAKAMLAMLNKMNALDKNGKRLKNEDGSDMSMFEAFSIVDGKLTLNKDVNMETEDVDILGHRMKRLLSRMHGEYSDLGKVALQRSALGRMAYMFRKFMVQGWKRRWETSSRRDADGKLVPKYSELGGTFTEGAYISTFRFLGQFAKDFKQFKWQVFSEYAKTGGNLTDLQEANIKRTLSEAIMFMLMWVMSNILIDMGDDDDDDNLLLSHLTYQTLRLKSELAFFTNPFEAMKILRSPAASMSVIENTGKLFSQLFTPHATFERGPWKDHYKWEKYMFNMFPVVRQGKRILDIENQINWFK